MASTEVPWHAAYPAPKRVANILSRPAFLQWLKQGKTAGKDFVLVDVRRADYEGGTIRGSINLPAQSLYPTIPALYSLLSASKVEYIIWYCGSSGGRGTRSAGWFADYIESQGDTTLKSLVLEGGIKGWAAAGPEYTDLMDEYDPSVWAKLSSK
ncbi:hypothetical protein ETB97_012786 [Aspergillus alliaceus]|uniref:Rhodanese-like domain-containing protein n=1 Tax=Petromyces alliaceus TaxID=209559 RepID=A0A5N7C3F1_PETAA|nr:Rhodanese-like domain-containing protein [Aspergillus alliaceus]KAF5861620.1 hypothetical protein ETB97_012786 [Aspergillus burnettii]